MQKYLLFLILSATISIQAGPYFVNTSAQCSGALLIKVHDVKISLHYDTISIESTMVCTNACKWVYQYNVDTTAKSYKFSYLTDFTANVAISFTFFDSLNRLFKFSLGDFQPQASVDSIWGDVESQPGNRTLYARIRASLNTSEYFSLNSFSLVGNLKQDTNVNFTALLGPLGCQSNCPDSVHFPQGKWNWFFTQSYSCFAYCKYVYSNPSSLGRNYSYLFSNDSIYGYQDSTMKFADMIAGKSLCNHTFSPKHPFISQDTSTYFWPCSYFYIGDKILRISTYSQGDIATITEWYFLTDGTSLESFLPVTNSIHRTAVQEGSFKLKQLRGDQIQIAYSVVKNSNVSLTLYSLSGKVVSVLFNTSQLAGNHELKLKIPLVSEGCYLLVLRQNDRMESKKFNYVK
jgi:hypothetical protein